MKLQNLALILTAAIAWPAAAQAPASWDSSGDGMLQGNYYFRQVVYVGVASTGIISQSIALYGTISFDGKGNYTVTGQKSDSKVSSGQPQAFPVTGTYGIAASGLGWMDNPLNVGSDSVIGMVSHGVFLGSSTQGTTNDVFVAVPAGSSPATAATFQGNYWLAYMNIPGGNPTAALDAMFPVTADGKGGFSGSVTATGYIGASSTLTTQSIGSLTYSFTNGIGTLTLPTTGALMSGSQVFYVSPDGNFAVGGSASGYDLLFAMKAASGTVTNSLFQGLYYTAGLDEDNTNSGAAVLDTFYGAFSATGVGTIIRDDRLAYFDSSAYDYTYDTSYALNSDGTYDSLWYHYAVGISGLGFVSIGKGPVLGISMGVQAPILSGSGVYLNPTAVVNAASWSPFIGGIAPGEAITIAGTGLSSALKIAQPPYPSTLNNTQVLINGRAAPLIYVSPTQLNLIVPYATELNTSCSCVQLQVINNKVQSNTVTVFMNDSAPGVFSTSANGLGNAAVLHANYSLVTTANPAIRGETLLLYVTGLGGVNPQPADGVPPAGLSYATDTFYVYMDGQQATTSQFVGLAPGYPGLYQINAVVPTAVGSGDIYLDIQSASTGFYTSQVKIAAQ